MKRTIHCVFLFLTCIITTANAKDMDWDFWRQGNGANLYVLNGANSINGNYARVWVLIDLDKQHKLHDGTSYMSIKTELSLNCIEHTSASISELYFSGSMGSGKQVYESTYASSPTKLAPDDWRKDGYEQFCKKSWEIWK